MVSAYPNFLLVLVVLVLLDSRLIGVSSAAGDEEMKPGTIGAIIDGRTRVGKEVKVAMEMAMDDFFNQTQQKLTLLVKNSHGEPVHAANAGKYVIYSDFTHSRTNQPLIKVTKQFHSGALTSLN